MNAHWKKLTVVASILAVAIIAAAIIRKPDNALAATRKIRVQLQWLPGGQFVGFYVAQHRGYYTAEGLDVTFLHGGPNIDPIKTITNGDVEVGLATADQVLKWNDGATTSTNTESLRALGTVFSRSLAVFMTHADSNIKSPADLRGKRVGVFPSYDTESILRLLLTKAGLKPADVTQVNFPSFVNFERREVDAYGAYLINEPVQADLESIAVNIIDPADYGIKFYSDTIIATRSAYETKRDLIERFVRASAKGWREAQRDPNAAKDSMKAIVGIVIPPGDAWDHQVRVAEAAIRYANSNEGRTFVMDAATWRSMEADLAELKVISKRGLVEQLCDFQFASAVAK